jgi:cation diffusion facilitator family transporter
MSGADHRRAREQRSQRITNLGLVTNALLAAVKTVTGIAGASAALLSDGINSISDTIYYLVVKFFLRQAAKPPDREHPYGHSQLETIASLVVGAFVLTTAVALFWAAARRSFALMSADGSGEPAALATLWVALATVALKALLSRWTRVQGRRMNSAALEALADDHRSDLIASTAVVAGILLSRLGYTWFDPAAGAVVAVVVFRTGLAILRNSARELMDPVPAGDLARQIGALISTLEEDVRLEEIRAHRFGPSLMVNLTIGVDGDMAIEEGDRICTRIEELLRREMPEVRTVNVHYHPAE